MIVDIGRIVIRDRIRKDFGDIQELADDIRQNGLINPPTVNKDYILLTGERRLRACRALGWNQIEVRMMDTRDAEHELNIEISENDVRKGFSKAERVDYMKRLMRIESAKAKERQGERRDIVPNSAQCYAKSRDAVAAKFGIGHNTMEREIAISDNREILEPDDFTDWDEGRLSTNKAYQMLKERLARAEEEAEQARVERDRMASIRSEAEKQHEEEMASMRETAKELEEQLEKSRNAEPKVVEKIPDDYASAKMTAVRVEKEYLELRQRSMEKDKKIRDLESQLGRDKLLRDADRDVQAFTIYTMDYIRRYGGHVWAFEQLGNLSEPVRDEFIKAIKALDSFAQQLIRNMEGGYAPNE